MKSICLKDRNGTIQDSIQFVGGRFTAGSYVLRIRVKKTLTIPFGRFKRGKLICVEAGEYAYIGSTYDLGCQIINRMDQARSPRGYSRGTVTQIAEELDCSEAKVRRALQLAKAYSPDELEEFLQLRTPDGTPLDATILYRLMYLRNSRRRRQLAKEAASNNWSVSQLDIERKRRFGVNKKARKGGRRPNVPSNVGGAIQQLADLTNRWLRLWDSFEVAEAKDGRTLTLGFPAQLCQNAKAAKQALAGLTAAIEELRTRSGLSRA